jgi:hypothetical protein
METVAVALVVLVVRLTGALAAHDGSPVALEGELAMAHVRVTVPAYPEVLKTATVELATAPAVTAAGVVAERPYTGVTEIDADELLAVA